MRPHLLLPQLSLCCRALLLQAGAAGLQLLVLLEKLLVVLLSLLHLHLQKNTP